MSISRALLALLAAAALCIALGARPALAHDDMPEDALAHVHFTQDACTLSAAEELPAGTQIGADDAELAAGDYAVATYFYGAADGPWYEVLADEEADEAAGETAFLWVDGEAHGYTIAPGCLAFVALAQAADAHTDDHLDDHADAHAAEHADEHIDAPVDEHAHTHSEDDDDALTDDDGADDRDDDLTGDDAANDDDRTDDLVNDDALTDDDGADDRTNDDATDDDRAGDDRTDDDLADDDALTDDDDRAGDDRTDDDLADDDGAGGDRAGDGRAGTRAAAAPPVSWPEGGCLALNVAEGASWHARPQARAGGELLGGDYCALDVRRIGGKMWFLMVAPEAAEAGGSAEVWVEGSDGGFSLEVSCLAGLLDGGGPGDG